MGFRRTDQRTDGPTDGRTDQQMDGWTDWPTDQRTDGQMDKPSNRDARTHLKTFSDVIMFSTAEIPTSFCFQRRIKRQTDI